MDGEAALLLGLMVLAFVVWLGVSLGGPVRPSATGGEKDWSDIVRHHKKLREPLPRNPPEPFNPKDQDKPYR